MQKIALAGAMIIDGKGGIPIPLRQMMDNRTKVLYDLWDSAYDAPGDI